tara:strand:- start:537 stop:653 length:117 start_codon:yes stop_codon:yes gene_type:complete
MSFRLDDIDRKLFELQIDAGQSLALKVFSSKTPVWKKK